MDWEQCSVLLGSRGKPEFLQLSHEAMENIHMTRWVRPAARSANLRGSPACSPLRKLSWGQGSFQGCDKSNTAFLRHGEPCVNPVAGPCLQSTGRGQPAQWMSLSGPYFLCSEPGKSNYVYLIEVTYCTTSCGCGWLQDCWLASLAVCCSTWQ